MKNGGLWAISQERNRMSDFFATRDQMTTVFLLLRRKMGEVNLEDYKNTGGVIYFYFSPKDACERLVHEFVTRKAKFVQPLDFSNAFDEFKSLLITAKRGQDER